MRKEKPGSLTLIDFILINIPVWLALTLAAGISALAIFLHSPIWLKIIFGVIIWQSLAASVMLLTDFKRKKNVFFRVLNSSDSEIKMKHLLIPLKGTLCGLAIGWAVRCSFNRQNNPL